MGWEAVARDRYLSRREGIFYIRRRVPKHLVQVLGREHVVESLRTSDYREANRLAILKAAEIQKQFDAALGAATPAEGSGSRRLDDLTIQQVEDIVYNWFRRETQRIDAVSETTSPDGFHEAEEAEELDDPQEEARELRRSLTLLQTGEAEVVEHELRPVMAQLCRDEGIACRTPAARGIASSLPEISADRHGSKYRIFRNLLRRGQSELLRHWIAQLCGQTYEVADDELSAALRPPYRRRRRAVTLAELIEEFKSEPSRRSMRDKVELDYGLLFRVMDEIIGHDSRLADISRDDCKAVRALLLRLPTNATKKFPGISLREAASKPDAEKLNRLNPVTVNSYLHKMSALFNYAVKEDRIEKNPARGLGLTHHKHSEEDRRPFTLEQLRRIFQSPIYTGCVDDQRRWSRPGPDRPRGTRFWIPLIALFHGMRLNEICQLRLADVQSIEGVTVFHVRPSAGLQRVKTEAGRRIVPLHSFLKRLQFEEYVATIRAAGKDRLFPDLREDTRGYYSDGFQKWFARLLAHSDAAGDRTSFHSFRHNWRDAMREARVPQERVRLIGGWKRTSTDEMYGAGLSAKALQRDIAKVKYPNLNLDHLLPS